jgi:predicted nucleotide-binding protein
MTRPPVSPPELKHVELTVEQMQRGIDRLNRRIKDLEAFDPQSVSTQTAPAVLALQKGIDEALALTFGHQSVGYHRYETAARLHSGHNFAKFGRDVNGQSSHQLDVAEAREALTEGKLNSLALLRTAIRGLEEEITDREPTAASAPPHAIAQQREFSKIFIVHGHDDGSREAVRAFLLHLGFEPIVLHAQPNKGRTIITKFREEAAGVGFAVVLMTPDDLGKAKSAADLNPRARQNVVFELGFFIGELGPERVAALVKGGVERPSDFDGVVYIDLDDHGAWQMMLARELRAAGLAFDANKVFG